MLGLAGARLLVGSATPQDWMAPGTRRTCFPGPGARVLGQGMDGGEPARPIQLIVPDGTWTHARKLVRLNPELRCRASCCRRPDVALLRAMPTSTAPCHPSRIVHALNAIEAPARFDALLDPFERMIDLQIEGMGEHLYARHHLMRKPRR